MERVVAGEPLITGRVFAGRADELGRFRAWLHDHATVPTVLNVTGPGGVGKSTLLREFGRIARQEGRTVVLVDGHGIEPTPAAFIGALWDGLSPGYDETTDAPPTGPERSATVDVDAAVGALNERLPLLLIDTFDQIGALGRFLREVLLPRLRSDIRVAIAGRYPITQAWGQTWTRLVSPVGLAAFPPHDAETYLARRGIDEPALVARLLDVSAGHPLALSLAADLVIQTGRTDIAADPSWKAATRGLVEMLLRDVADDLRAALEAAALVRQFDEATLVAMLGRPLGPGTFSRLVSLSFVRAAEHGLMLHDDIRLMLSQDLRERDGARFGALRAAALAHYRAMMREAPPHTLTWLVGERFFLWEDAFVQTLLYRDDDPLHYWLETARPDDLPEVVRVWEHWVANVLPLGNRFPPERQDLSTDRATFEALLRIPGVNVHIVRNTAGRIVAFGLTLAVCKSVVEALPPACLIDTALHAYLLWAGAPDLPATPDRADTWYCATLAQVGEQMMAEANVLGRWCVGFFATGGTFICATVDPLYRHIADTFGFTAVPELALPLWDDGAPLQVLVLDLAPGDADAWMDALMTGRTMPKRLRPRQIEQELRAVLPDWHNDARLAASALAGVLRDDEGQPLGPEPARLRDAIRASLHLATASASDDQRLAYDALRLAYFDPAATRVDAAARLAVSRRTFYRLLERGIHDLARALARAPESAV